MPSALASAVVFGSRPLTMSSRLASSCASASSCCFCVMRPLVRARSSAVLAASRSACLSPSTDLPLVGRDLRERLGAQLRDELARLEAEVVGGGLHAAEEGAAAQARAGGVGRSLMASRSLAGSTPARLATSFRNASRSARMAARAGAPGVGAVPLVRVLPWPRGRRRSRPA